MANEGMGKNMATIFFGFRVWGSACRAFESLRATCWLGGKGKRGNSGTLYTPRSPSLVPHRA